jgi:D-mannonate dehydratase
LRCAPISRPPISTASSTGPSWWLKSPDRDREIEALQMRRGRLSGCSACVGHVEGPKKFLSIHQSPYHGLNFCQGTVAEMLHDPGREIYDVIRYFGARNKIVNVHFRNIRGHSHDFVEVFPDEGAVDLVK